MRHSFVNMLLACIPWFGVEGVVLTQSDRRVEFAVDARGSATAVDSAEEVPSRVCEGTACRVRRDTLTREPSACVDLSTGSEVAYFLEVQSRVERFDRRGTEPFEPFEPSEFFQNRNFPEFFLRKID